MNLLHLFILILFVLGILLIITTFSAYSKLSDSCKEATSGLRNKLRWAICLGTSFITIAIGYSICINASGCECSFGEKADWKIYSLLVLLMAMGGCMAALSLGIKSDLKTDNCDIDLDGLPDAIMYISIGLIVLPFIYFVYVAWSKNPLGKSKEEPKKEEPKGKEYKARQAEARKLVADSMRSEEFKEEIALAEADLSVVKGKIEKSLRKGVDPKQDDLIEQKILSDQIEKAKSGLKSVSSNNSNNSNNSKSYISSGFPYSSSSN